VVRAVEGSNPSEHPGYFEPVLVAIVIGYVQDELG
jgi:hypothetical protein